MAKNLRISNITNKLTPTKAIKNHCKLFCMNDSRMDCESKECVLKLKMSALKKIKAFCGECAPDFKPQECDGIVLNTTESQNYGKCPLWVYRFGRNPHLKGKGRAENLIPFKKSRDKMHVF